MLGPDAALPGALLSPPVGADPDDEGRAGAAGASGAPAAGAPAAGAPAAGAAAGRAVGAADVLEGAADVTGAAGAAELAEGTDAGATGAPGMAGPAAGRVAAAAPSVANAARSLRATGGSMLDDGPLTNSPISLSFAKATLLSMPSSEATSCTRGFAATFLLSGGLPSQADRYSGTELISSCSSVVTHLRSLCRSACSCRGTPTTHTTVRVAPRAPRGDVFSVPRRPGPRDARVGCACWTQSSRIGCACWTQSSRIGSAYWTQSSRIESGCMSILAPVSLAARRAFWPSLPIARESW